MAEFIERERLITAIHTSKHNNPHSNGIVARAHNQEHQHFLSMVMAQPAADVVEVVRCKDCRYGEPYLHYFYCENDNAPWAENTMANLVDANDFCSYGERRAGE